MKIKKTKFLILVMVLFLTAGVLFTLPSMAENDKHYVTRVNPASFTDIVEFYGNTFTIDNTYTALCLERAKGTPQVGTELTYETLNNSYVQKILYYGYNGPARWSGFSSDGEAILCTSILLSHAYSGYGYKDICDDFKNYIDSSPDAPDYSLAFSPSQTDAYVSDGVQRTGTITLLGDNRLSLDITLPDDMKMYFPDGRIKSGTVTLRGGDSFYLTGPLNSDGTWFSDNLYINETVYSTIIAKTASDNIQDLAFLVPAPQNSSPSLFVKWYDKGTLEIIKSSSNNDINQDNPNYSLENATYQLFSSVYDAENLINPVATLVTNSQGYAKADNLTKGTYYLRETIPPKGYNLSSEITPVTINTMVQTSINLYDVPGTNPFEIVKYGETKDGSSPLQGAGFMVCPVDELTQDSNGNYIWNSSKVIPLTSDGSYELFTNENGYALSIPLPYGTYLVKETTVPENHLPVDNFLVTIDGDSGTSQGIYLTDKSFRAYIKITKQDSTTNKIILDNPATFKIWSYSDNEYISFDTMENGKTIKINQFQTDNKGTLITPEPLMPGKYLIEEVCAPTGYTSSSAGFVLDISNSSQYDSYIDEDGNSTDMGVFTVCIENSPITGQIQIKKELEYDDSQIEPNKELMEGITFNIYALEDIYSPDGNKTIIYNSGELVETICTDSTGYACSTPNLPLGIYEIEEVNPPEGYIKALNFVVNLNLDNDQAKILSDENERTILSYTYTLKNFQEETTTESTTETATESTTETTTGIVAGTSTEIHTTETATDSHVSTGDKGTIILAFFMFFTLLLGILSYIKSKN